MEEGEEEELSGIFSSEAHGPEGKQHTHALLLHLLLQSVVCLSMYGFFGVCHVRTCRVQIACLEDSLEF